MINKEKLKTLKVMIESNQEFIKIALDLYSKCEDKNVKTHCMQMLNSLYIQNEILLKVFSI